MQTVCSKSLRQLAPGPRIRAAHPTAEWPGFELEGKAKVRMLASAEAGLADITAGAHC